MDASSGDPEARYRQAVVHAALRSVVHDLNNPLGTITMAAAALRSATDPDQRAELIDLIEREAMRAGATARATAERSGLTAAVQDLPLGGLLEAVQELCRTNGVEVDIDGAADAQVNVSADALLLPRALASLVADAHRSPGRVAPVQLACRVDGEAVEVSIRDDGRPVPAETARRPFRPFAADGATPGRGSGLEVAAGRYHVRNLGGSLALVPGEETGNTVVVRLPLVLRAATARATDVGSDAVRHALVVDDDQTMRNMLEVVLRRDGWTTTAAADGRAAAAAVDGQPVDLVLLDLHVGAEHGPEIAARLEAQRPGVGRRVVYLSGDVPPSGRIDGRPAIAKPFVLDELYRVADAVASADQPL